MKGHEFIRKVKALGKRQRIAVRLDASRGKGSHQTLYSRRSIPEALLRRRFHRGAQP
ncbi:MAG: hypothetical protein ACYCXT_03920 [Acidiferrobacteraceae bacterium]